MKKITLALTLSVLPAMLAFNSCEKDNDTLTQSNAGQPVDMDSVVEISDSIFVENVLGPLFSGMEGIEGTRDTIAEFIMDKSFVVSAEGYSIPTSESYIAYYQKAKYSTANIRYWSVDGNGDPIVLSARMAWNSDISRPITGIVVHMHETMFGNDEAPSVYKSNMMERLAIDDNLVIIPDYIGFGASVSQRQTYLSHNLIARNCLDAECAVIKACKDSEHYPSLPHTFAPDAGTYITGYSQGGGNGLALHKYIETKATQEQREMINLKHSFIGSGPYNPVATFNKWLEDGKMTLPVLLPLCIDGMQAGGNANLTDFDRNTCFTKTFIDCAALQEMHSKKKSLTAIYQDMITELKPYSKRNDGDIMPYFSLDAIMSQDGLNPNSSARLRIGKALADQNLISGDWTPSAPITFFYTSKDDVVPPVNTTLAYNKWKDSGKVHIIDCNINNHLVAWMSYEIYAVRCDLYNGYKDIKKNIELNFIINETTKAMSNALLKMY